LATTVIRRHRHRLNGQKCKMVTIDMDPTEDPETVYKIYRQRGDCENIIKELKDGLYLDRLSCPSFWANQLRLLLVAAAYVLMQELRLRMKATRWPGLRLKLFVFNC